MNATGMLALQIMERDGQAIPANVQRFDEPAGVTLPTKGPSLLLAMLVWGQLPKAKQERVKAIIRCMAYSERADSEAVQLNNLLNGRH